ncbi:cyclase family protein [Allofrancisella inopinata]|nr:cyclase family protein [Allofrancisella inopinata]
MSRHIYLSYILDENTPSYGNRNSFVVNKNADMSKGDPVNDTSISTTVHMGTHIDMPYHFFENGQTIIDFDIDFFDSKKVLFIEIKPQDLIIKGDLIERLEQISNKQDCEFLIVKTGICYERSESKFWESNYGFDPSVAIYLRENYPNIRIIGFDSISVSSFQNRILGRVAHKEFLSPESPILLLEDMDLREVNENMKFDRVTIAPMRIANSDGLPCTVIAEVR